MNDITSMLNLFTSKNNSSDTLTTVFHAGLDYMSPFFEREAKRSKYTELAHLFEDKTIDYTKDPWLSLKWEYDKIMKHINNTEDTLDDLPLLDKSEWFAEVEEERNNAHNRRILSDYKDAYQYVDNNLMFHKHIDYTTDDWTDLVFEHANFKIVIENIEMDLTIIDNMDWYKWIMLKQKTERLWIEDTTKYLKKQGLL